MTSDFQIPVTIEALLTSRIDRLAPPDKRLLQFAAVTGNPVHPGVLEAIGEFSPEQVRQGLESLQASEFLFEVQAIPNRGTHGTVTTTDAVASCPYGGLNGSGPTK